MKPISDQGMEELVQLHARQLGEHVDSVQIFVTRQADGGETTQAYSFGTGNFYGRLGQIMEWIVRQEEFIREEARVSQRKGLE